VTEPIKHPDVVTAIHAVASELSVLGIAKDRVNDHHKFRFRGIDDVYCALSPLLAKHGLVILPSVTDSRLTLIPGKDGKQQINVSLRVIYEFRRIASTDADGCTCSVYAEATDSGDKATSKAMSMAYKTMAFQVFCIPTEGSDDPDYESHERSAPKAETPPEPKLVQPRAEPKLVPFPNGFGSVEQALAFLPNCKTEERLKAWTAYAKKEFKGETDLDLLKQGFEKFKKGEP
jgi:hypothetical protein